jgi:hypothetical protein
MKPFGCIWNIKTAVTDKMPKAVSVRPYCTSAVRDILAHSSTIVVLTAATQKLSFTGVTHGALLESDGFVIDIMTFDGSSPLPESTLSERKGKLGISSSDGERTAELYPRQTRTPEMVANASVKRGPFSFAYTNTDSNSPSSGLLMTAYSPTARNFHF